MIDSLRINTGELFRKQDLIDPMMEIQTGLSTPADVEGRKNMGLRPLHDLYQLAPVSDIFKFHLLHRSAGNDKAVEILVLKLLKGIIKTIQMVGVRVSGFMRCQFHKGDPGLDRKIGQHTKKIQLCFLF